MHIRECLYPNCFNPDHLYAGTQKDNTQDMIAIGRGRNQYTDVNITHCKRGHEYTPSNTYIDKKGNKNCKECKRLLAIKYREEKISLLVQANNARKSTV